MEIYADCRDPINNMIVELTSKFLGNGLLSKLAILNYVREAPTSPPPHLTNPLMTDGQMTNTIPMTQM